MTKICTDLEQSKILEEFLPHESADMGWNLFIDDTKRVLPIDDWALTKDGSGGVKFYHAWSLTALLNVISEPDLVQNSEGTWLLHSWVKAYPWSVGGYSNPVDACYEMIIKLHEKNLL